MRAGQDLLVGGFVGIGGTVYAASQLEMDLRKRLPQALLDTARSFRNYLDVTPEEMARCCRGNVCMQEVNEGGIFAALWNMAEQYQVGFTIHLRRIPVRQETIEICEALEVNPYALLSGGCALLSADNGNDLLRALGESGVHGALIGKITDSNDRLILNGEGRRYLNRPEPDEIEKIKIREKNKNV